MKIIIDRERCKGCGLCVFYCKRELLKIDTLLNKKGIHPVLFTDKEGQCGGCGFCALMCPDDAIIARK